MPGHDIIVIGASAGGVEALKHLVSKFPADLNAVVFVVVHIPANSISVLPDLLNRWGPLTATPAQDRQRILPGHIYVAPPDLHLLLEPGQTRLLRGPRENHTRPAIDPLFRSAARAYGSRVVAVVLSGMLNDGTAGLLEVKRYGGIAIAQSPDDALFGDMPRSAIQNVSVDYVQPIAQIASTLVELSCKRQSPARLLQKRPERRAFHVPFPARCRHAASAQNLQNLPNPGAEDSRQMDELHANAVVNRTTEAQIGGDRNEMPSIYSCPDCGGVSGR